MKSNKFVPHGRWSGKITGTRETFLFLPIWAGLRHASIASTADFSISQYYRQESKTVRGQHHTKSIIVVPVVRVVVVTDRNARVVLIVVPRAAAQRKPSMPKPVKARTCGRLTLF